MNPLFIGFFSNKERYYSEYLIKIVIILIVRIFVINQAKQTRSWKRNLE